MKRTAIQWLVSAADQMALEHVLTRLEPLDCGWVLEQTDKSRNVAIRGRIADGLQVRIRPVVKGYPDFYVTFTVDTGNEITLDETIEIAKEILIGRISPLLDLDPKSLKIGYRGSLRQTTLTWWFKRAEPVSFGEIRELFRETSLNWKEQAVQDANPVCYNAIVTNNAWVDIYPFGMSFRAELTVAVEWDSENDLISKTEEAREKLLTVIIPLLDGNQLSFLGNRINNCTVLGWWFGTEVPTGLSQILESLAPLGMEWYETNFDSRPDYISATLTAFSKVYIIKTGGFSVNLIIDAENDEHFEWKVNAARTILQKRIFSLIRYKELHECPPHED